MTQTEPTHHTTDTERRCRQPLPRRQLRPGHRGDHRVRPAGDRRAARRPVRPLPPQRPEPDHATRPDDAPLVRRRRHGARHPPARRQGRVVPQPLRRFEERRPSSAVSPTSPAATGTTARGGPNTNVGGFAGTTWAMVEAGGCPVELTYELETVGRNDFNGTLPGAFTAHPKVDPDTGEMHAMVYAWAEWLDHVQYVVVGNDGRVRRTRRHPAAGHDDAARHVADAALRGRLRPAVHRRPRPGVRRPLPVPVEPRLRQPGRTAPTRGRRRRHRVDRRAALLLVPPAQRVRRRRRLGRDRPLRLRRDVRQGHPRTVRRRRHGPARAVDDQPDDGARCRST